MQRVKNCKFVDIAKDILFWLLHEVLVLIAYVQRFLNGAYADILSWTCPQGYKTFFVLNSAEPGISTAIIKAKILKNNDFSC